MSKKIVLIDAEEANWQLFRQAFEEIGIAINCVYTDNCSDGAQKVKELRPDLVFVQLDPDVTDALEFVRGIKANRRFKNLLTVVYSSRMYHYNFLARGHGADCCITCPSATDEIKKVLEDFWIVKEQRPKLGLF